MAKPELGIKRIDPETGRKFYDLNKDPIVSPYTGKSYPRTYFESASTQRSRKRKKWRRRNSTPEEATAEVVSLEDADEEAKAGEELPEIEDEEDVDLGEDDDDTFLAEEEEEDDDVADIIGVGDDDDEI